MPETKRKINYSEVIPMILNEYIILRRKTRKDLAYELEVDPSTVDRIAASIRAVTTENAQELINIREKHTSIPKDGIIACAEALGKKLPDEYLEYEKARDDALAKQLSENGKKVAEFNSRREGKTKTNNDPKPGRESSTTPLWEQQNLLNEAKIIEQIGDLNDAVIPKYARDIVDALNKLDTHLIQLINKLS